MIRLLALLVCLFTLTAQRAPILVPEVSQDEVQVRQGFTGTELLLFGAILDPSGNRAGQDYDIVVVLKGPTEAETASVPAITTTIPHNTLLLEVTLVDGIATVDLSREFEGGGGTASMFGR